MRRLQRRDGFSLVSAIFLLVVVSLAAAAMLTLSASSRQTSILSLLAARSFQAARSGIEWGVAKVVATPTACPAATFSLTEGGLNGFDVTVTCSFTPHVEGSTTTNVFLITSLAERGAFGNAHYVSRRLQSTVSVEP